jgi:hypothetical protein
MSIRPKHTLSAVATWAREWQQLHSTATNRTLGRCLHGWADLAVARTPRQAVATLHRTHSGLLRHSADTIAEATRLWRRQSAELLGVHADGAAPTARSGPRAAHSRHPAA